MRINNHKLLLWDFDGVIKDSVSVKTQAFISLFDGCSNDVIEKIRVHHESNGGMSRYDKVPIYLRWAGEEPSKERVYELCDLFSKRVLQGVINAPWVPGAEGYLRRNPYGQSFILVSATPQNELEKILHTLDLYDCFNTVFGSPTSKIEAIRMTVEGRGVNPRDCLMIGDAQADMDAAKVNNVPFVLRLHESNSIIFSDYTGPVIKDLTGL